MLLERFNMQCSIQKNIECSRDAEILKVKCTINIALLFHLLNAHINFCFMMPHPLPVYSVEPFTKLSSYRLHVLNSFQCYTQHAVIHMFLTGLLNHLLHKCLVDLQLQEVRINMLTRCVYVCVCVRVCVCVCVCRVIHVCGCNATSGISYCPVSRIRLISPPFWQKMG